MKYLGAITQNKDIANKEYVDNQKPAIATQTSNGLLSADDKLKLDGIEAGANNYTHPTYTAKSSGLYKVTIDDTGHISAATAAEKDDITALGIPTQDTVYTHPDTHPASMITGLSDYISSLGYGKVASGSYVGDGTTGTYTVSPYGTVKDNPAKSIALPFSPNIVLFIGNNMDYNGTNIIYVRQGTSRNLKKSSSSNYIALRLLEDTLKCYGDSSYSTNNAGTTYNWMAFA